MRNPSRSWLGQQKLLGNLQLQKVGHALFRSGRHSSLCFLCSFSFNAGFQGARAPLTSSHRLVLADTRNSHQVIDDGTMSGQAINDIVKEIGLSLKPREKCKDEVSRYFDE